MWCLIVFRYSWYSAIFVLAGWIYEHKMGNYSGVTIFALKITAKISKLSIRCEEKNTNSTLHRFTTLFEVRIKYVIGMTKSVMVVLIWIKTKVKWKQAYRVNCFGSILIPDNCVTQSTRTRTKMAPKIPKSSPENSKSAL